MVVPGVVVLMIWKFIYSPNIGVLNQFLTAVGLENLTRPWLGDFNLTLYAIIFIGFPWIAGIATLIYLAGFQAIPTELMDAAAIDGAGVWARFWKIELPLVASQIKLLVDPDGDRCVPGVRHHPDYDQWRPGHHDHGPRPLSLPQRHALRQDGLRLRHRHGHLCPNPAAHLHQHALPEVERRVHRRLKPRRGHTWDAI